MRPRLIRVALGLWMVMMISACAKRTDPAVATAGGGAAIRRNVITMKGAAR